MTRSVAREMAILLGFSLTANGDTPEENLSRFFDEEHFATLIEENSLFSEMPTKKYMDYIQTVVRLISEHRVELDECIEKYSHGWKTNRISKMAAAILRCAICEILWLPDVPDATAVNEAVELAKKYEDEDVVAFINGVLGGFLRGEVKEPVAESDS